MKSYGYPSEYKVPAQNSRGMNQPGRKESMSTAQLAAAIRSDKTFKGSPTFTDPKHLAAVRRLRGLGGRK